MLKRLRIRALHHQHAVALSFQTLVKAPIASTLTILVIAIALLLPALLWVSTHHLKQLTQSWQQEGRISLYLQLNLSSIQQEDVLNIVKSKPMVGDAKLISPAEGLALLQQQEGMDDIIRHLPHNPLPAVIEVTPALSYSAPLDLEHLYTELKALPQVEQAKLDKQWVSRLHALLGLMQDSSDALLGLLAIAVLLIVGNTLRLMIQNRHEEIQVLKLVGATDAYIMRPFLYTGIWYGMIAAVVALIFLQLLIFCLLIVLNQLAYFYELHLPSMNLSIAQMCLFILFAGFLGWLGANLSVKRQLASIEP